jgi:DNA-binding response OmpR family regulator
VSSRKPTVLCIDRYKNLLPSVKLLLTNQGYEVLTACDVADGLACLANNSTDAVILDYTLCCHDHRSHECIANKIQALHPGVKLMVWCADDSIYQDLPPCADAVLTKPVDPGYFLEKLSSLVRRANGQ